MIPDIRAAFRWICLWMGRPIGVTRQGIPPCLQQGIDCVGIYNACVRATPEAWSSVAGERRVDAGSVSVQRTPVRKQSRKRFEIQSASGSGSGALCFRTFCNNSIHVHVASGKGSLGR